MVLYDYLRVLTKPIKDSEVRMQIAEEMKNHILDQRDAYIAEGMDEDEALEEAVRQMGDPKETGKEFAEIYHVDSEKKNLVIYAGFSILGLVMIWCMSTLGMNTILSKYVGYLLMVTGLVSGAIEKCMNLPFFYGKNQSGGSNLNSYGVCAVGIALSAAYAWQWLLFSILEGVILYVERKAIEKRQIQKTEAFLWKTGVAVSDIDYKGTAEFDGVVQKVRVTHDKIAKGSNVAIVDVDGFHLIVEEI